MLPPEISGLYDTLYGIDHVYQADCWKLCGDAHCCSFARHKAKFRLLTQRAHDLPLLPGEFEFLESRGWQRQFQDFERHVTRYDFGDGTVQLDTVSSRRPACACDHGTRTTVCRLYPLLPQFDVDGRLVGTEPIGLYEELELLEGMAPACELRTLPFGQINLFLRICELLGSSPVVLFHLAAYRTAKRHLRERLAADKAATGKSAFRLFENAFLRRRLFDHAALKAELRALHVAFVARYGDRFRSQTQRLIGSAPEPGVSQLSSEGRGQAGTPKR